MSASQRALLTDLSEQGGPRQVRHTQQTRPQAGFRAKAVIAWPRVAKGVVSYPCGSSTALAPTPAAHWSVGVRLPILAAVAVWKEIGAPRVWIDAYIAV